MITYNFEKDRYSFLNSLQKHSIILSGIGIYGSIPVVEYFEDLEKLDAIYISLAGFEAPGSAVALLQQLIEKLSVKLREDGQIGKDFIKQFRRRNIDSIGTAICYLREI
jgi:hypothetical protein